MISIHAPSDGSDHKTNKAGDKMYIISIHAPSDGSDNKYNAKAYDKVISIHAPSDGSDLGATRGLKLRT